MQIIPAELNHRVDWDDFRIVAAVARTGSGRAAARELRLTPQAVTRRVSGLEQKLGIRLFNRVTHGLALTDEGRRIMAHVTVAESALQRATTHARDAAETVEGECRLAVGDGLATYWLPRFLPAFAERHPGVSLLIHTSTERMTDKSPSHDIQIQYAASLDASLTAKQVATLHCMLFASSEYLAANGTPIVQEDLARHRLVDVTLGNSGKGTFASWRGFANRTGVIADASTVHCENVRWGAGIGLLPTYGALLYPNLVPIIPAIHFPTAVYACYEREKAKRPAVRATLQFLRHIVFDRERMPWFADDFHLPDPQWPALARGLMDDPFAHCTERPPAGAEAA